MIHRLALLAAPVLLITASDSAGTTVFTETFTSTSINNVAISYIGGWFTPQTAFQQWIGSEEASITSGVLQVAPTFGSRFGGIILNSDQLVGAGDYTLSFDLAGYSGDGNDTATITIWTGSGYDLTMTSGNGLILNNLTGTLGTNGTATATLQATLNTSTAGAHQIDFTYDGTSAVALFFGATTGAWPFPVAQYDNISLAKVNSDTVIPEPTTAGIASIASLFLLRRRRR